MSELNITALSSSFVSAETESSVKNDLQNVASPTKQAEQTSESVVREVKKADGLTPLQEKETVQEVNDILQSMQRNLSFSFDEQLGESIILVKDSESEEVIRQIPSEELVVLRKKMDDVVGILFDTKV